MQVSAADTNDTNNNISISYSSSTMYSLQDLFQDKSYSKLIQSIVDVRLHPIKVFKSNYHIQTRSTKNINISLKLSQSRIFHIQSLLQFLIN